MDMESLLLSQGYFVDTCAAFVIYWESWLMKSGESRRFCRRRGRNSQAKGPFSDSTLESVRRQTAMHSTTDEAIRHRWRIFQVKRQS